MDNNTKNEKDNPALEESVAPETPLKHMFVDYVGNKKKPEDDAVTVEMIVETLAEEFPEFLMAVAEENWIRGYQQALDDVEEGEKLFNEMGENPSEDEDEGEGLNEEPSDD